MSHIVNDGMDVVTLGEAMLMLVADEAGPLEAVRGFLKSPAGAETNVATGLARLGLKVGWASRLGDDSMARYLLAHFQSEGIDCSHVCLDADQRTGFQFKGRVTDGSDPPVEYHRKDSAASKIGPADLDVPWLQASRHLHVTGVFPALSASTLAATQEAIRVMQARGKTISFDPNLRPTLWSNPERMRATLNALAFECDWILPGVEEARLLTQRDTPEDMAAYYLDHGAKLVVIKLGAHGAYYRTADSAGRVPAFPVARVIDTVGAGDAFAVGVISALLQERSVPDAVRRGAWMGARAVQCVGDSEGLPWAAELQLAGL